MNKTKQISIIIDNDPDIHGSIVKTITDEWEHGHRLEFYLNTLDMTNKIQKISEFVNNNPSKALIGTEGLKNIDPSRYECWDIDISTINDFIDRIFLYYADKWDRIYVQGKYEFLESKLNQELWEIRKKYTIS